MSTGNRTPVEGDVLLAVAVGGAIGSLGRWAVTFLWAHRPGEVAWSTVLVNVAGALLLGLLTAVLTRRAPDHRYLRPLLGVGVLGGFTTFSTAMGDVHAQLAAGHLLPAVAYLGITLAAGLVAVVLGDALGRTAPARTEDAS